MKTKTTHTDKKDMKRTHTNWSDNSKHSLWLSRTRRKKLQIVVSLGELFLFVAHWTMILIFSPRSRFFCWSDPDFSIQLSGRSGVQLHMCNLPIFELLWRKTDRALTIYLRKPILMNFQIASTYTHYISSFSLEIKDSEYVNIIGARSFLTQKNVVQTDPPQILVCVMIFSLIDYYLL